MAELVTQSMRASIDPFFKNNSNKLNTIIPEMPKYSKADGVEIKLKDTWRDIADRMQNYASLKNDFVNHARYFFATKMPPRLNEAYNELIHTIATPLKGFEDMFTQGDRQEIEAAIDNAYNEITGQQIGAWGWLAAGALGVIGSWIWKAPDYQKKKQ